MAVQPSDVFRVTAKMQLHGTDDQFNVWHIRCDEVAPITDLQAEEDIADWVYSIYNCVVSHMLNSVEFTEIDIYNVTQDRPMVTQDYPVLTFGTLDAYDLPWGVALLQSYDTDVKKVTGRKYFGGLPITDITDGGGWSTVLVTLFACVLLKVVDTQVVNARDWMPGLWSRTAGLFREHVSGSTDFVPAYQRRRRPGHGS